MESTPKYAFELKNILLGIERTVAVAESLTGGNLQVIISSVSGSSDYFEGGVTAYNIDQKVHLLQVERNHASSVNCVSKQVAEEMAVGVRRLFGSFIGLATTGYAEPWPEGEVELPFAFYAINIGGWMQSGCIEGGKRNRVAMQQFVAETVLRKTIESFEELRRLEATPDGLDTVQQWLRNWNPS